MSLIPREGFGQVSETKLVQLVDMGVIVNGYTIVTLLPTSWRGLGFRLNSLVDVMAVIWTVAMTGSW